MYPIKSPGGTELAAEVEARGFRDDRRWMLVAESGDYLSQRRYPRIARYEDHPEGAYWGDPNSYYDQNLAFFATATLDGTMANLRVNPERAGQNGPARTTP